MRHHFLLNPAAGRRSRVEEYRAKIESSCTARGVDFVIYETTCRGDATRYVRESSADTSTRHRFYACGGDGTLSETIRGGIGQEHVEFALLPIGTGNDFWRNFSCGEQFFDIDAQLDGVAAPLDAIRVGDRYCINMINIGFDCNVVATTAAIKRKRFVPNGFAYVAGIVVNLFRKFGTPMCLEWDGETVDRPLMLSAISGGGYCGGGFHSSPACSLSDGLLDLCMIEKVSRPTFLRLVGSYKDGSYLTNKLAQKYIRYLHTPLLSISFPAPTQVCLDGEIEVMSSLRIECVKDAIRFSVPQGSRLLSGGERAADASAAVTSTTR